MAKYRKKPVVIHAERVPRLAEFAESTDWLEAVRAIEGWSGATWCGGFESTYEQVEPSVPRGLHIRTLEGTMVASEGDWVIQGVQGEFYPCKPDIFAATYEPVDA